MRNVFQTRSIATMAAAVVLFSAFPVSRGFAEEVFNVDTEIDDPAATACLDGVPDDCSLRGAITSANFVSPVEEVTINLPIGTYLLTVDGASEDANQTGDLDVIRSITLQGSSEVLTDIDGGGVGGLDDRLLEVHGADTVVVANDLTFTNSKPPADLHAVFVNTGAAIRLDSVRLENSGTITDGGGGLRVAAGGIASLDDCLVWYNAGFFGVGVLALTPDVTITNSEFRNNVSSAVGGGGGLAVLDAGIPAGNGVTIVASYFHDNVSSQGAAAWVEQGAALSVLDSRFEDNNVTIGADRRGGAIFAQGNLTIEGSTFVGGSADEGVGLYFGGGIGEDPVLDIVNSTFVDVALQGGTEAIRVIDASAEFLHVTMSGNLTDVVFLAGTAEVSRSLFEGGCQSIASVVTSGGYNLGLDATCWDNTPAAGDEVVVDLLLEPIGHNGGPTPTRLPLEASAAVDRIPGPCLPTDQRGLLRPETQCDSGAVERHTLDLIFIDDFEDGSTDAWSTVVN